MLDHQEPTEDVGCGSSFEKVKERPPPWLSKMPFFLCDLAAAMSPFAGASARGQLIDVTNVSESS